MKKRLLLIDLITKNLRKEKLDMFELEVQDAARRGMKDSELGHLVDKNSILIPLEYSSESDDYLAQRNLRSIGTEQLLIGTEPNYIIRPITDISVFTQAGATYMPLQVPDMKIPSFSGIMAQWVADGEEPADDGDNIDVSGARFAGKRLYVCLDIPTKILIQGGVESEKWLRESIIAAITARVDSTIGGILAGTANYPAGMGYAITSGSDTKRNAIIPKYSDIDAMEEALSGLHVPISNYGYITSPAGRRILRKIYKDEAAGGEPVYKDGKINDYPAFISDAISDQAGADGLGSLLLFGNWPDLGIVQFGAYDIIADPYTLKRQGKVQLTINSYWDFKGMRGSLPTSTNDQTQANEYAHSFTSLAIK